MAKNDKPIVPKLTAEAAEEFVKLINTGVGPENAVLYLVPAIANWEPEPDPTGKYDPKQRLAHETANKWFRNPLTLKAINAYNGGDWTELEPERRLRISVDKHFAELAYFLYSHDYAYVEGTELKKINDARTAIMERLSGKEGPDSPFEKAMREILEKKIDGKLPAQMPGNSENLVKPH